jgi:N-hydroxyarylamine O-acetyltransferase
MKRAAAVHRPELFGAYLKRLGLDREPPSVGALFRLHRAQIERVPYETTWIAMGERWTIDQQSSIERIALQGRGGYCFHLNGALAGLLTNLGYRVELHVGGVYREVPVAEAMTNHLVLTVHELPTDRNLSGVWYVDTGLGDALHEPLPLMPGVVAQGPMRFELVATPGGVGDWQFTHDAAGSFVGMAFENRPATFADFEDRHEYLSTSPESGFVRTVSVQHRNRETVTILRALTLTTFDGSTRTTSLVQDRSDWFELLNSTFALDLRTASADARERLWQRALASHDEHEKSTTNNPVGGER